MSEINTQTEQQVVQPTDTTQQNTEVVPKDVFERTKADMFKYKSQLDQMAKTIEEMKINRLKETQNWEEVARAKEKEADSYKERNQLMEQAFIQGKKDDVLKTSAIKHGMVDLDLLGALDLPEVQVETTSSGKIIVHGADAAIQSLKVRKPHLFKQSTPSINPQTPEVVASGNGQLGIVELQKLEAEWRKNPTEGNKRAYHDAIIKFKKQ